LSRARLPVPPLAQWIQEKTRVIDYYTAVLSVKLA